ncbi:hypothetical protein F4819DRAFT_441827 [Hypoxylon fuscum]|nr:hypothetical protein F4819DRAFT_441827 [Hypoxylon fuscum]
MDLEHIVVDRVAATIQEMTKGKAVQVYFQDPGYTSVCKEILRELEHEVIECFGARGFTMIDENTLVIAHCASFPIREIVADIARPLAMCW